MRMQDRAKSPKHAMRLGVITCAVVLAIVTVATTTCLLTTFAVPLSFENAQQLNRTQNNKRDALLVDLRDENAPTNKPGSVITDDVKSVANMPSDLTDGGFNALWDCEMLRTDENERARMLVTMREVQPVPGRIWTNWYNGYSWTGWKSTTPG